MPRQSSTAAPATIKTSPTDHFPMEQVGLERWNGSHWAGFGKIVTAKG